jgi:ferric-dicitrate binding protein FerR (iron transport regulator)
MSRRILATVIACLLAGIPLPGQAPALGVVTQSLSGHLGTAPASAGATIYDGDRLDTDDKGALSLRAGTVQLSLSANTTVVMQHDESGLTPTLERGSVVFRAESGGLRLSASDVRVRPQSSMPTVGQMALETCSVLVTSRVQALEVTAGTETKIVEEGKSYRVLLGGSCSAQSKRPPLLSGQRSRFLEIVLIGTGAAMILILHEALESPDRP